jgi:superfamily I DNA/RNA helicase
VAREWCTDAPDKLWISAGCDGETVDILPPGLESRLERLAPDQRAAATAPPGPILVVAPAGSGKTTTLVARIAWLVATGVDPATIAAITFNRRAAVELGERLDAALLESGVEAGTVRVRTFHAIGLEILREAGRPIDLADREAVLRGLAPDLDDAALVELDGAISRLKVELEVDPADIAADPGAGPLARGFVAYAGALQATRQVDFDDLVLGAIELLEADPAALAMWRSRCAHLLVDEVQDVDRAQLRLALLLAAPANRILLVGDDDQSIYGWRLADVRRVLGLDASLPGLSRIDLEVNYRCPAPVVERAVRLVEHNTERFAKAIRSGPDATGRLLLVPDGGDDPDRLARAMATWPEDQSTRAILARTNRELIPAVVVALRTGRPFRAARLELPLEAPGLDGLLVRLEAEARDGETLLSSIGRVRDTTTAPAERALATALLAWAAPFGDAVAFVAAVRTACDQLAELRRDDASLTLATAHSTKGLEFDHVIVVGMEAARFPSARAVDGAIDPARAYEEERRLAYVAWTRARRSLTLLYDPAAPSPFLLEAFTADELGLGADRATIAP